VHVLLATQHDTIVGALDAALNVLSALNALNVLGGGGLSALSVLMVMGASS